jgi:hypothetical protein
MYLCASGRGQWWPQTPMFDQCASNVQSAPPQGHTRIELTIRGRVTNAVGAFLQTYEVKFVQNFRSESCSKCLSDEDD